MIKQTTLAAACCLALTVSDVRASEDMNTPWEYSKDTDTPWEYNESHEKVLADAMEWRMRKNAAAANRVRGDRDGRTEDYIAGGAGNDKIWGYWMSDRLWGGKGNDKLFGGHGNDRLWGDVGNDFLYGGRDNDVLYGGRGNDWLSGGSGDDFLYGGRGKDRLAGGHGNDWMFGGPGADRFYLDNDGNYPATHDSDTDFGVDVVVYDKADRIDENCRDWACDGGYRFSLLGAPTVVFVPFHEVIDDLPQATISIAGKKFNLSLSEWPFKGSSPFSQEARMIKHSGGGETYFLQLKD